MTQPSEEPDDRPRPHPALPCAQPSASSASSRSHVSTAPPIMPLASAPSISSTEEKCERAVTFVLPPTSSNVKVSGPPCSPRPSTSNRNVQVNRAGGSISTYLP